MAFQNRCLYNCFSFFYFPSALIFNLISKSMISAISWFQDGFNDLHDLESSLASFPIKPLQALKYDLFPSMTWVIY